MLGFRPVGAAAVAEVDADLVPIDAALRGYEAAWDAHVDAWLVIKARAHKETWRHANSTHMECRGCRRVEWAVEPGAAGSFGCSAHLHDHLGMSPGDRPGDVLTALGWRIRLKTPQA